MLHLFLTQQIDSRIRQVSNDGFDISTHIAHFGEFGGLYFDQGRVGELGQSASDLGFANTGWANHQDIFRTDLIAQFWIQLHAAPAVTQGNGHSALGIALTDNVAIQLSGDFFGR